MQLKATTPSSGNVPQERRNLPVVFWPAPTEPSRDAFVLAGAHGLSDGAPAYEDLELHVVDHDDHVSERTVGDRLDRVVQRSGRGESTFKMWWTRALRLSQTSVPETQIHPATLDTGLGSALFNRLEAPCDRFPPVAGLVAVSA